MWHYRAVAAETDYALGIRIDPTEGVAFFGIDDVNRQLRAGRTVKEIRPGGAVMKKVGEGTETVTLTLAGCDIQVVFEAG